MGLTEGVGPYDGMHNLRIRLGAAMDLVGPARRDVGIAPYKVHSDSPEIGVHRGWGRTTVGADALGRPRGTEVIRLPVFGESVFCPIRS